jgi:hypothetical protein
MHIAQDLQPWMDKTPQPVALAAGRVVRAVGPAVNLEACIKAAEVLARYVAVASLASAAATRPRGIDPPEVANFSGNLSFGVFENAVRATAAVAWEHPLREQLRLCLKSTKKRKAIAGIRLQQFVELRNELGHSITPADDARARAVLERDDPVGGLIDLFEGLEILLAYPLLVLLGQEHRRGRLLGRFAFFAGEGEPIPQELELRDALYEWESPYLCTPDGLIPLAPGLIYQPRASDGRFGLYLLDGIGERLLRYKSMQESASITRTDGLSEISSWIRLPFAVSGRPSRPILEEIVHLDGRSLHGYLSGEAFPQPSEDAKGENTSQALDQAAIFASFVEPGASSVREFEQLLSRMRLGIAYRDVIYCLATLGGRAELSSNGVRAVSTAEPTRVLATLEITPTKSLRVALYGGALTSGGNEDTEEHELRPGESADRDVDRIESLIEAREPTGTGSAKSELSRDAEVDDWTAME